MPPPPDLSSYILSPDESQNIFTTSILPSEFPSTTPPPQTIGGPSTAAPLAILLVGQTGAGKTSTAPALLSALSTLRCHRPSPPAHFIADTYKTFHPAYSSLCLQDSALASRATGFDARRWLSMACREAISRRVDVLLESACRHPSDFVDFARAFHEGGYRVEVAVLAVPEGLSRLGILTRYYRRLPEAGSRGLPVRLTPRKIHDDSYAGLVAVAEWIDDEEGVDQVVVVRRGNSVAFGAERVHGKLDGSVVEAVERERRRPLGEEERRSAEEDLRFLEGVEAAAADLAEVKGLLEPVLVADGSEDFPALLPLKFSGSADASARGSNVLRLGASG